MKKLFLLLSLILLSFVGFAQNKSTEDDIRQFYTTIKGDYTSQINDSIILTLHLTPIWEYEPYRWLYMEAVNDSTGAIVEQKIIEIQAKSEISYNVVVHDLAHPEQFVGKWSNRNYFDGFNTGIFKGKSQFHFMKTLDYEYQTSWNKRKNLKCFPSGDLIHFKFVQEDERLYVKRLLSGTSNLVGFTFYKL